MVILLILNTLVGILEQQGALQKLSSKTVTVQCTTPITEKLMFLPWNYINTYTHELESKFNDAWLSGENNYLNINIDRIQIHRENITLIVH